VAGWAHRREAAAASGRQPGAACQRGAPLTVDGGGARAGGRSPAGVVAGGGAQQARQPADGVRGRVQQWSTASGPAGCGAGEAEHGAV
jgi:hypothetical protein